METQIKYHADSRDFDVLIGGDYVGSRATRHEAEALANRTRLERAASAARFVVSAGPYDDDELPPTPEGQGGDDPDTGPWAPDSATVIAILLDSAISADEAARNDPQHAAMWRRKAAAARKAADTVDAGVRARLISNRRWVVVGAAGGEYLITDAGCACEAGRRELPCYHAAMVWAEERAEEMVAEMAGECPDCYGAGHYAVEGDCGWTRCMCGCEVAA